MGKMPVLFIGHGSPMNVIENNEFTKKWSELGETLPTPKAILVISAHWYTNNTLVLDSDENRIIFDMYGFPKELYEIKYPAKGSKDLSLRIDELLDISVLDSSWGLDHGTWSILYFMYPYADIPVIQLSIDQNMSANEHYELGEKLKPLRDEGILIIGSGNIVHSFKYLDTSKTVGHDWAIKYDKTVKEAIFNKKYDLLIEYEKLSEYSNLAFQTPDHYLPLLYILGLSDMDEKVTVFNEACIMGSMSMTSYIFG